jgi:hypothetical protein
MASMLPYFGATLFILFIRLGVCMCACVEGERVEGHVMTSLKAFP